jgi:hypothetical protein
VELVDLVVDGGAVAMPLLRDHVHDDGFTQLFRPCQHFF